MRFVMMVKSNERAESGALPDEKMLAEMGVYNGELIKNGIMLAGEGLQASSRGAKVRLATNKATVIDGPFAEAKELVGGFWLLKAASMDEAVALARKVPFKDGEIEIRPVYEHGADPAPFTTVTPRKPGVRRYMLMLRADRLTESGAPPSAEVIARMGALMEDMIRQGALLSTEGLQPTARSKRVKFIERKSSVIDGPFTESKELIAGYFILQAASRAEAEDWARRWLEIHAAHAGDGGEIEVRPVMDLEDYPVDPREKPEGWRDQERKARDGEV